MLCEAGADIDLGDKQGSLQTTLLLVATHRLLLAVHQRIQLGSAASMKLEKYIILASPQSVLVISLCGKACFRLACTSL